MLTQEQLSGSWNEIVGKVKQRWGSVTDDDLRQVEGNVDQLVGLLQRKTGEARASIEEQLRQMTRSSESMLNQASQAAGEYAAQARDYASQAVASARGQYQHAEDMIRRRPVETVATCFTTGLLIGVVVGLMSRSR